MLAMNHLSSALRAFYAGTCCIFSALISTLAALVFVGAFPAVCMAAPPPQKAFDVATIKPSNAMNPPPESINVQPDCFQASGMTLKELIKVAWDLNYGADDQVSGGPPWVSTTRFDLYAKEDAALTAEITALPQREQGKEIRAMLRDLITQRFHLVIHHETRQLSVYELVVAKGGPKMLPAADTPPAKSTDTSVPPEKPRRWIRFAGVGKLEGFGADTETLITALSMQPEVGARLVLDKTGLTGNYDFTLKWTPDIFLSANESASTAGPSLFTALQEELGLRLDSAKAPVDRIVIDQVTQPSAN